LAQMSPFTLSASSVTKCRQDTFSAFRRPPFNVPPTKPPTSLISSRCFFGIAWYSAKVSFVRFGLLSRFTSSDQFTCMFFQLVAFRVLVTSMFTLSSYVIWFVAFCSISASILSIVVCHKSLRRKRQVFAPLKQLTHDLLHFPNIASLHFCTHFVMDV